MQIRKRGAQPENKNALKHGFYSTAFRNGEIKDLDTLLNEGLRDEIDMMRVVTRRVIEYISKFSNPKQAAATLGTLGLAAIRLASLLKTNRLLEGTENNTSQALNQALSEVMKEFKLDRL